MTSQWPSFETMRAFSCCENEKFVTLSERHYNHARYCVNVHPVLVARVAELEQQLNSAMTDKSVESA